MRINPAALRTIRQDRGVSLTKLAEQVSCDRPHLSNVEAGRRQASPQLIRELADALKVDLLALLGPDTDPADKAAA